MRLWTPEPDEPELLAWYQPLLALGRRLREEGFAFPPRIDDYAFAGRIDRPPRPAVWTYVHWSGGMVYVDAQAQTYCWQRHQPAVVGWRGLPALRLLPPVVIGDDDLGPDTPRPPV